VTILGVFTQFKAGVAESIHEKEEVSNFDLFVHKVTTMFHTLMDLESSMKHLSEYHSPEEFAVLAEKNAQVYAQVTTFIFDFMLLVTGTAGIVGVGEGIVRQIVPDKAGGVILSFLIFINCAVAIMVTIYEMRIHHLSEEVTQEVRRKKFDNYVLLCLSLIPTTGTLAVLTWGLALEGDPLSVQGWLLRTDWGGNMVALQSLMLVIAICLTIQMLMLTMTATYVAKHLGGLLYLCINLAKFVAWLLLIYGAVFLIAGLSWADDAISDEGKQICYTFAALGAIMLLQSILGILASRKIWDDPHAAVKFYKMFWPSLVFTFFFNNSIFLAGGVYARQIESSIDEDWETINNTIDTSGKDGIYNTADDLQPAEVVSTVTGSFRMIVVIGSAVTVYLLAGIFTAAYVATRPSDVSPRMHTQALQLLVFRA
jgi:hypothetical protein